MVIDECFEETLFNNLYNEFPDVSAEGSVMGGRRKMNTNTPSFNSWIKASPTWNMFYNWLNSDNIFHTLLDYYETDLRKWDSVITKNNSLSTDCFIHIDWSSSTNGYTREIHRDSDKRIWNFLIFFNDKDWEGGDFCIHTSDTLTSFPDQIWDKSLPVYKTIEAKKNLGLFFLSTPNSYHSVTIQQNTNVPRQFIYGSFSYRNGDVFKKRSL